jgi:hypothetical protein
MKKLSLRIPDDLHAALAEWAKQDRRSLHAQILWLLQQAAEVDRKVQPSELAKVIIEPAEPERKE